MMEVNKIHFTNDGSIIYDDKNMQIYGLWDGGIEIYYDKTKIDVIMLPILTRTHINVVELVMIDAVLDYIGNKRWTDQRINTDDIEEIVIITDSRNCLNLLQHEDHTNDVIMIGILQNIEKQYHWIDQEWEEGFISFYWVQSHQQKQKEVKQKALRLQCKRWNQYKYMKKDDDWNQHIRQWKITGRKEWYQTE